MVCVGVVVIGIDWCGFYVDVMVMCDGLKIFEIGGWFGGEFINLYLILYSVVGFLLYCIVFDFVCGVIDGLFDDWFGIVLMCVG